MEIEPRQEMSNIIDTLVRQRDAPLPPSMQCLDWMDEEKVKDAWKRLASGHVHGKIVLRVAKDLE